jgi:DNA-directed RNA polymerase subunit RPC12/RpoP
MCSNCNQPNPIVNKKYDLCDECNYKRLHDGQSKADVARNKAVVKRLVAQPYTDIKKSKSIKQRSEKQHVIDVALQAVKESIRLDAKQSGEHFCKGCGKTEKHLDCSHILSVKHRKDLSLEKANINLLCRTCHVKWESGDLLRMISLNCFEKDLQYMKEQDPGRYNKLFDAIVYLVVNLEVMNIDKKIADKARKICSENEFILIKC